MSCGCCACLTGAPSASLPNRPGLSSLRYRIGTHATFLEAMIGRLARPAAAVVDPSSEWKPYSLSRLTTRETDDPAVALLDAWAAVADVLTFYQERWANEGYLRTATERRSVIELGRLVGYAPRPGVSATAYLAYTIDDGAVAQIPAGAKAQSIPGPDEQPQTFETSEPIEARGEWNDLTPRMEKPQAISNGFVPGTVWLEGATTNLRAGDGLLFVWKGNNAPDPIFHRLATVTPSFPDERTAVTFQLTPFFLLPLFPLFGIFLDPFRLPPSMPPKTSADLPQDFDQVLSQSSDIRPQLLVNFFPELGASLWSGLAGQQSTAEPTVEVYALRRSFAMFGYNAPRQIIDVDGGEATGSPPDFELDDNTKTVYLDSPDDSISPGSWVVVRKPDGDVISQVDKVMTMARTAYGVSGKTTKITLFEDWRNATDKFDLVRTATVIAASEPMTLANEPVLDPIGTAPKQDQEDDDEEGGGTNEPKLDAPFNPATMIDLGKLYQGLKPGRWVIVQGERIDIPNTSGVIGSELSMIALVEQRIDLKVAGDWAQTRIHLAAPLAYRYKRETVKIYGNVAKATHGETRLEILGAGDATQSLQTFGLKQSPLTFVSAPTPDGVATTLEVRVNDVRWHEARSLSDLLPSERGYITRTGDDGKTSVVFGTGENGARLPSAPDNVRAKYRSGIGKGGNVRAGQIATALTRPLGVKDVVNPAGASGGADPETRDQARRNVPIATRALGRVVSLRDYEDFARAFAGIAKARVTRLSSGARRLVHLTIAGADDIPIDTTSDLYRNFVEALTKYGDPNVSLRVDTREAIFLGGAANVQIDPDHLWPSVHALIRASLLDEFSFERRELGQPVFASEVIAAIQRVPGVVSVDLDRLLGITADMLLSDDAPPLPPAATLWPPPIAARLAEMAEKDGKLVYLPAQLVYMTPAVPDAFVLTEVQP